MNRSQDLPSVAVIGSGISGLSCARTLADHNFDVHVFDKGRGPGGRMSTRRTSAGLQFDHGAQYFTARDRNFQRDVDSWRELGIVAEWQGRIVSVSQSAFAPVNGQARFVGTPSMNSICRHLGDGLPVQFSTRVAPLRRTGSKWTLIDDEGQELGGFDVVVLAVPAPQVTGLLAEAPAMAQVAANVPDVLPHAIRRRFDVSRHDRLRVEHPKIQLESEDRNRERQEQKGHFAQNPLPSTGTGRVRFHR